MVRKPTWGDTVRIESSASAEMHPGSLGAVCGIRELRTPEEAVRVGAPVGTTVLLVELEDGTAVEVPELLVELMDDEDGNDSP